MVAALLDAGAQPDSRNNDGEFLSGLVQRLQELIQRPRRDGIRAVQREGKPRILLTHEGLKAYICPLSLFNVYHGAHEWPSSG